MRTRNIARRIAGAMVVTVVAAGLTVVSATAALATTPVDWSADVSDLESSDLLSGVDGSVTVGHCSSTGSTSTKTFSESGSVKGTTPMVNLGAYSVPALGICGYVRAVDGDGVVYGQDLVSYPITKVAAYESDGSTQKWVRQINADDCPGGIVSPSTMRLGSDGNLYVGGVSFNDSCGHPSYLTSFTPAGVQRWQIRLTGYADVVTTYNSGVVVLTVSSRSLYYFDYDGMAISTVPFIESGDFSYSPNSVNEDGEALVGFSTSVIQSQCAGLWYGVTSVAKYSSTGRIFHYDSPDCVRDAALNPLPGGGVAFLRGRDDGTIALAALDDDGVLDGDTILPSSDGGRTFTNSLDLTADTNGNVLLSRRYSYTHQSQTKYGIQFVLADPTAGRYKAVFNSDVVDTHSAIMYRGVGQTAGKMYFLALQCNTNNCSSVGGEALYAVNFAELGMDYPRGAILGVDPVTFDTMSVAGDSFSAGIGSLTSGQSYIDVPCSRSPNAYGPRLNEDPAIKLQMPGSAFVACSGAVVADVHNNQVGDIPPGAKSVFLTIGGNDVKFPRLAAVCIFLDCSDSAYQDEFEGYLEDLHTSLAGAYQEVLDRADGATVYVMGYPHILPLQNCENAGGGVWWYALQAQKGLDPSGFGATATSVGLTSLEALESQQGGDLAISNDEAIFANTFENELNLAVSDAVDEVDDARLVFVSTNQPGSPMAGHELCSEDSFFNGISPGTGSSFHPNLEGQEGMYQIARDALEAHQPQYVLAA